MNEIAMKKSPPLLSIITVCLNAAQLECTCESIVNQTFQDFEWIVIDGGSNAKTLAIFEKYKYRMDYFVSEPDGGIYFGMNRGIEQARGVWLHFLNAGDCYVDKNILSNIDLRSYTNSNIDILHGKIRTYKNLIIGNDEHVLGRLDWLRACQVQQSAAFHKKTVFQKFGNFRADYKIVSDYAFYLQLVFNNCRFKSIDHVITNFNKAGASNPSNPLRVAERKRLIAEYFTKEEIQQEVLLKTARNYNMTAMLRKKITDAPVQTSPAISIQLPVYNKAPYLRECLDSIISQTFADFEVICVDDHSTDGSWDILQEYAARDRRFILFRHEANLGTLAARKRCFMEARGDYMAFIDADDLALPHMLSTLYALAQNDADNTGKPTSSGKQNSAYKADGIDFVQCAGQLYDPDNTLARDLVNAYTAQTATAQAAPLPRLDGRNTTLLQRLLSIRGLLWLSLVSRKIYQAIIPYIPDGRLRNEDALLILMLAFFSNNYRSTNMVIYRYRANPTSYNTGAITPDKVLNNIEGTGRAIDCGINFLRLHLPDRDLREQLCAQIRYTWINRPIAYIASCIAAYPDSKDNLYAAYLRTFGELPVKAEAQRLRKHLKAVAISK